MRNLLSIAQEDLANKLRGELLAFPCVALLGEFRMGKTSTLKSLQEILSSPRACVSLAELECTEETEADRTLYSRVLQALADDWEGKLPEGVELDPPDENLNARDKYHWFEDGLKRLASRPVTILLDDAERLADLDWGEQLFRSLRATVTQTRNVRVVLAGTLRLGQWADGLQRRGPRAGLWDLIQGPKVLESVSSRTISDAFPDHEPLSQWLTDYCGGHPYCLHHLTRDLDPYELPIDDWQAEMEARASKLATAFDETFRCYWKSYDPLTRRVCFLLAANPIGLSLKEIRARLDGVSERALEPAIAATRRTGVLIEQEKGQSLRLIGSFAQWYKEEIGFVEDVLASPAAPVGGPAPLPQERPTTEFTFLPDQGLVLMRRGRFLSQCKLEVLTPSLLRDTQSDAEDVPSEDKHKFSARLDRFSRTLGRPFAGKPWLEAIRDCVEAEHRLRLYIPREMNEFPFELLPLDPDGRKRIGLLVPISRQLIGAGQEVARAPLVLPSGKEERLRVLVVAAEVGGNIVIEADGTVRHDTDQMMDEDDEAFQLGQLHLMRQVRDLQNTMMGKPDLVREAVFLSNHAYEADQHGVKIVKKPPRAAALQGVLEEGQFDILHFVGHALRLARRPAEGGLLLHDRLVHMSQLTAWLREQQRLGFVYLSCCESGKLDIDRRTGDLGGVSHACIEAGVPAVLGMRWRIPVRFSHKLTVAFYEAFFELGRLDEALHRAVRRVHDEERDPAIKVYAAAPVLTMH